MMMITYLTKRTVMKNNELQINLTKRQVEFLIKCIDEAQSTQSLKPVKDEVELIRELSRKNDEIQDDKYGQDTYYDLN